MSLLQDKVYCSERKDGYKLHELVEEIDWKYGKINHRCMWCGRLL